MHLNKVIRYSKVIYDRMIARGDNAQEFATRHKTNILSGEESHTLKELFTQDTPFYCKLFENSHFVIGDGPSY